MKIILNFAIAFEEEQNEKFLATRIIEILKNMLG